MKIPVSVGYRRPRDGTIRVASWLLVTENGDSVEIPAAIPNWDYQQELHIVATLVANLPVAPADSGLTPSSAMSCHVQWHASGTGLRGTSQPVSLQRQRSYPISGYRASYLGKPKS